MFTYINSELHCNSSKLSTLAKEFGTPLYVYSAAAIRDNYRRLAAAFAPLKPLICFAVKANFNLALLDLLKREGSGFDIVSGGELYRALTIGADPAHIVFAGVGKTDAELAYALDSRVGFFNVESADELARLNALAAARGVTATVALRLNPGVSPDTHRHINTGQSGSKFGVPVEEALALIQRAADFPALTFRGAHIHIGSQIPDPAPTLQAVEIALDFIAQANPILSIPSVDHLDIGGGFPVPYHETALDQFPAIEDFAAPLVRRLISSNLSIHLEPGRFLIANAGALVATVQAVKNISGRRTLVVDAGMNTLLRPALYDAYHQVLPLQSSTLHPQFSDIVGPICESSDTLARDRELPPLSGGDQLAFMNAGAYGYSMASHYNSQPRPAEVLVEGDSIQLICRRETYADLIALEIWPSP